MGTSLNGLTPKDTYPALLKTSDNTALSATAKTISDGSGNDSALSLSTSLVGIGTTTGTARLQVKGSGATSATTSLLVQNSSGTAALTITDDLTATFGGTIGSGGSANFVIAAGNAAVNITSANPQNSSGSLITTGDITRTDSGTKNIINVNNGVSSTAASFGTLNGYAFTSTINQTLGTIRGLYIAPTITASTDFRAIETSVGNVIFGSTSGNVLIGTSTDAGFKLDVNGTVRVQGNLTLLGTLTMGNGSFTYSTNPNNWFSITGSQGLILNYSNGNNGSVVLGDSTSSNFTVALSNVVKFGVSISRPVTPIAGTTNLTYNSLVINNVIDYTNASTSIARGLYIAPTLTSVTDFRAIETTVGNVLLGTTSGNFSIGTTATTARTTIKGSGSTSATTSLLVQNSASASALTIKDDLSITTGGQITAQNTFNANYINMQNTGIYNGEYFSLSGTGGRMGAAGIVTGASTINASAILQADSTTQGFLPPRMTTAQKNAIATPTAGLVVYDSTLNKLCVRTVATWETITSV